MLKANKGTAKTTRFFVHWRGLRAATARHQPQGLEHLRSGYRIVEGSTADIRQTSVEESYDDRKPKNLYR